MSKQDFSIDKHAWSPSLIPGPIVLVSTVDADGIPNVAPKSWVQMVAFDPPTLMFSGTKGNPTENNIEATACFGINVVSEAMLPSVVECLRWRGPERIKKAGWTMESARKISSPLVEDSPAHIECTLDRTLEMGSGFIVFGRIVAASIDGHIADAPIEERYRLLEQTCFLEDGIYTVIRDSVGY